YLVASWKTSNGHSTASDESTIMFYAATSNTGDNAELLAEDGYADENYVGYSQAVAAGYNYFQVCVTPVVAGYDQSGPLLSTGTEVCTAWAKLDDQVTAS